MTPAAMQEVLQSVELPGWTFLVCQEDTRRPYLQVTATAQRDGGVPDPWRGKKWFLSERTTRSELVHTAFAAVRERYLYRGAS